MWEKVAPLRSEGSAGNSAWKEEQHAFNKTKQTNSKDLDDQSMNHSMCVSAHQISDFQVLALAGHIRNFKSIVLLHFLEGERTGK